MTAPVLRRQRAYWWLAVLVLPFVNPPLFLVLAHGLHARDAAIVLLVAAADALVLCPAAIWAWEPARRWWKLGLGLLTALAFSVPFAFAEFILFFAIACSRGGCD
jgi:hypothetical protein